MSTVTTAEHQQCLLRLISIQISCVDDAVLQPLSFYTLHPSQSPVPRCPRYLRESSEAEVLSHVVEGEVSEPGHPHVARDEYANGVVHLLGIPVVVQEEQDLHPPLPLLRLVSVQVVDLLHGRVHVLLQGRPRGHGTHGAVHEEEEVAAVGLQPRGDRRMDIRIAFILH